MKKIIFFSMFIGILGLLLTLHADDRTYVSGYFI